MTINIELKIMEQFLIDLVTFLKEDEHLNDTHSIILTALDAMIYRIDLLITEIQSKEKVSPIETDFSHQNSRTADKHGTELKEQQKAPAHNKLSPCPLRPQFLHFTIPQMTYCPLISMFFQVGHIGRVDGSFKEELR